MDELRGKTGASAQASPNQEAVPQRNPRIMESAPSLSQSMERNRQLFRDIEQRAEEEEDDEENPQVQSSQTMQHKPSKTIKVKEGSKNLQAQSRTKVQSENPPNPKKRSMVMREDYDDLNYEEEPSIRQQIKDLE